MVRWISLFTVFSAVFLGDVTQAAAALVAPPTDEQIEAVVKAFNDKIAAARTAKTQVTPKLMSQAADEAIGDLDIAALSTSQIAKLIEGRLLPLSTKSVAFSERLGQLAMSKDAAGAEGAAMRLFFLRVIADEPSKQAEILRTVLRHPGLQRMLKDEKATSLFDYVQGANPAAVQQVLPDLLALDKVITPDMPTRVAITAPRLMKTVLDAGGDMEQARAAREPLRLKLLELVRSANSRLEANDENAKNKLLLARAERMLDGAYVRGTLLNGPAPALDFVWSNTNPPIRSLSDLVGKVVVLDFWTTDCRQCVQSFPDIAKLQAHYEGYPVVILEVTSIQGVHVAGLDGPRIDTKGNPQREQDLMAEYIRDKTITWSVAFSKQEAFNPEYGVDALPHMVILDAKGIVRHRGLHPNSRYTPFAQKVEKIDDLLKEAGLPTPPPLPTREGRKDDK